MFISCPISNIIMAAPVSSHLLFYAWICTYLHEAEGASSLSIMFLCRSFASRIVLVRNIEMPRLTSTCGDHPRTVYSLMSPVISPSISQVYPILFSRKRRQLVVNIDTFSFLFSIHIITNQSFLSCVHVLIRYLLSSVCLYIVFLIIKCIKLQSKSQGE